MNILIGILAFLVMLNVIVILHEFGHYMAARAFGVYCHEFSIGMGPALYQRQGKETIFSIRALPIGGYVSMAGEQDGSQDEEEEDSWLAQVPQEQRLNTKPKWQQIIIMAAGVAMNLVLALVLFTGLAMARGYVVEEPLPIVYEVVENSPAQAAGLQSGDEIIKAQAADGSSVEPKTLYALNEFLQFNNGPLTLTVLRDGTEEMLEVQPVMDEEDKIWRIGITAQAGYREIGILEAFQVGAQEVVDNTVTIFRTLGMLLQGKGLNSLSGPVGIYKVTDKMVSYGLMTYLSLCALISLNIGIFNLLPIPALDGGRIVILLLESIFRRRIPTKWVETVILASFVLLFGIMIFATYNDIIRYFF